MQSPLDDELHRIERWFQELSWKRIKRGVFRNVPELIAAVLDFMRVHNQQPKPFVWTKKVEQILEKLNHCKPIYETLP